MPVERKFLYMHVVEEATKVMLAGDTSAMKRRPMAYFLVDLDSELEPIHITAATPGDDVHACFGNDPSLHGIGSLSFVGSIQVRGLIVTWLLSRGPLFVAPERRPN